MFACTPNTPSKQRMTVVAAKVEFDEVVFVEPAGKLQGLLRRFSLKVAKGIVGHGEKFGSVGCGRHDVPR